MTNQSIFFKKLFEQQERIIDIRITSLSFLDEIPQQQIVGRATQGSININGNADIRRTCSLTMLAMLEEPLINYQWAINNKFSLEIGLYNTMEPQEEDIIWFPMGVYVITSFNYSENLNQISISINGKDKMCLLDGSINGKLMASSYDFGNIEEVDKEGNIVIKKIPLEQIIREAVHMYAREPYHNILINDLDDLGLELIVYRGKEPMYFYMQKKQNNDFDIVNFTLEGDTKVLLKGKEVPLSSPEITYLNLKDKLIDSENNSAYSQITIPNGTKNPYAIMKMEYGDIVGYHPTDLVYAGDLTANVGESLTSVLNKIKNQLGQFEYFYNLKGQFVFQKKKNRLQENFSKIETSGENIEYVTEDYYSYEFLDTKTFTSISNVPQIDKVKNDFSIWGQRADNDKILIHERYAIDKKPVSYKTIPKLAYYTDLLGNTTVIGAEQIYCSTKEINDDWTVNTEDKYYPSDSEKQNYGLEDSIPITYKTLSQCDWREIIYQMALDYYRYHNPYTSNKNLWQEIVKNNGELYPQGITGYEQYYEDIQGFWRQLYEPTSLRKTSEEHKPVDFMIPINYTPNLIETYNKVYCLEGEEYRKQSKLDEKKQYYVLASWTENTNFENDEIFNKKTSYSITVPSEFSDDASPWSDSVRFQPETLKFWFDFLDTEGELKNYSVPIIGTKNYAKKEQGVTAIFYPDIPEILFLWENESLINNAEAYKIIKLPKSIEDLFSLGSRGISAVEKTQEVLYQNAFCNQSINFSTLPIYSLEPNTLVKIDLGKERKDFNGDYIVNTITIPLTYNGTMTFNASKVIKTIF